MIAYIDSSAILRTLLNQPEAFSGWEGIKEAGTSELAWIECCRVLERLRMEQGLDDLGLSLSKKNLKEIFDRFVLFEVSPDVLSGAAGSFPTIVGTLDAIHLRTALLWRESFGHEVQIVTHDQQLAIAAQALNFPVIGI